MLQIRIYGATCFSLANWQKATYRFGKQIMLNLPPLDTLSKAVGLIAGTVTIISVIVASFGGFSFLHFGQQSNDSTPTQLPYTTTVLGDNITFFSNAGFSITYPSALSDEKGADYNNSWKITIFLNSDDHTENINVWANDYNVGQRTTLQDVQTDYIHNAMSYKDFKLILRSNATLGGDLALKFVYTANIQQNYKFNSENKTVQIMYLLGMHNGRVYELFYKTLPNDYDKYLPQAQQIIDSFRYT